MATDPWAGFEEVTTAPAYPGVIPGRPKVAPPPTAIQLEDQEMQREQLRLSQEAGERAAASEARQAEKDRMGSVEQGKAASFLKRAINAETNFSSLGAVSPRSLPGQAFKDSFPNASNYLSDANRQKADQAEREFIAAILRYDSGAAIPPEEFVSNGQIYFPRPGDTSEVLAQKAQARRVAIEGLMASAGPAGKGAALPAETGTDKADDDTANPWAGWIGEDGKPLGPGGGYGRDPETGEWSIVGTVSAEGETTEERAARELAERRDAARGESDLSAVLRQGVTLGLSDEIGGLGNSLGRALTGDFNLAKNYRIGNRADDINNDRARANLGWAGTAAEIIAGGSGVRAAGNALFNAARSVSAAPTRSAIQGALVKATTREGAGLGALGGFGYGEGAEGSLIGVAGGAAAGGVLGRYGQKFGNANANANRGRTASGGDVLQAADDLRIPVIPAVTGGTTARRLTSGARQGFISDRPISGAVDKMEAGGLAARTRISARTGAALPDDEAGELVRKAANVYSSRTSDIGGKLYTRADAKAGGEKLALPTAIKAADDEMAQLAKSPGGTDSALFKDLEKLRDQMKAGTFEVDGIRAFRSRLRNEITERGLRGTPQDVAYGNVLRSAEDDMIAGLQAAGKPEAAAALKNAAAFWRKRVETIDEVLEPVLGKNAPRSGEQIVSALEGMANPKSGNAARLRQLFQAMPKAEARSVAATLINRMGRPAVSAADQDGFSFATFLTSYNRLSPRARSSVFPPETRAALDKLATVAQGVKQAGGSMNSSNTAGAITAQAAISGLPFWLLDPLSAIGVTGGQYMVGKLLASPRVARWVASAPKTASPQAQRAYVARLGGIAKAEPAIANELGVFQRAANDNFAKLAAEEPEKSDEVRR